MPVYHALLEHGDFEKVLVCNAGHVKNVPGRKTDMADAEWLCQLLECGLLAGSFIPPAEVKAARDVIRYRAKIAQQRVSEIARLANVLQDAGIKLDSVAWSVSTKSGRLMIEALIGGERRGAVLAELAIGRMRRKILVLRHDLRHRTPGSLLSLLTEIGAEIGSPLLEPGQLSPQAPDLAVNTRQFRSGLLFYDVTVAVPGTGEGLDLTAEQSQPRVSVHMGLAVLQRARVDRVVDFVLSQPKLLAGGLIAQRCALTLPFVVRIGHAVPRDGLCGAPRPGGTHIPVHGKRRRCPAACSSPQSRQKLQDAAPGQSRVSVPGRELGAGRLPLARPRRRGFGRGLNTAWRSTQA